MNDRDERGKHSFTMRLTADDQNLLTALCAHYHANRPDSLRRAMREILSRVEPPSLNTGVFIPLGGMFPPIAIRLQRKEKHDGANP
jgi:hypothetical protein